MAKKTAAGGKVKKTVAKVPKTGGTTASGGGKWTAGDKYNSSFNDHKKSDGKFKGQRIEKKRG